MRSRERRLEHAAVDRLGVRRRLAGRDVDDVGAGLVERARDARPRRSPSMPPSTQSVAEMRTDIGRSAGQTARMARKTSSGKRSRFSSEPPYSSRAPVGERRDEAREQVAVRAVELEHVEAARDRHARRRARTRSRTWSMSARVISRGDLHAGACTAAATAPISGQSPSSSGSSLAFPHQLGRALARRSGRAAGRSSPASAGARSRRCAVHAATCSRVYMPVQPREMRASGETQVISVITSPAPPSARAPRWTRWKSFGVPSIGAVHVHRRDHDAVLRASSRAGVNGVNIGGGSLGALPALARLPANQRSTLRDSRWSRRRRFSWLTRWLRVSRL